VTESEPETDEERRRRLREKVFGDVLPETTSDEARDEESSTEEWLKGQVPPHHG